MAEDARRKILARVAEATEGVRDDDPGRAQDALPRGYRQQGATAPAARLDRFEARLVDYGVDVVRTPVAGLPGRVAQEVARRRVRRLVVPGELPAAWLAAVPDVTRVDPVADAAELVDADATLTGCAVAIAETGTLILDGGPGQGPRAGTLVPDVHLCVVHASLLVELVPEAVARTKDSVAAGRPLTWISGPSATSDIELVRVAGVHGPRTLVVLLVTDA
ncbi:MAG: LUD domain-containing protein [Trueperaceae bacterium]|nr:LUD domain-containing protein [Trueperaceae bacterium]